MRFAVFVPGMDVMTTTKKRWTQPDLLETEYRLTEGEQTMAIGPIQLIALGFEEFTPTGKILPALDAAVASGAIRLIDLQFVGKDANGDITALEMTSLSEDEEVEFGAVIGGLIGAGMAGEEGTVVGALEGALAAAEQSYGLTAADVLDIASELAPGDAAALLMIEHTWAVDFRDAVLEAGGVMLGQGFLTPGTLILIGAELEAQAAALAAIEETAVYYNSISITLTEENQ
jgi:uncharacterized membrane protein